MTEEEIELSKIKDKKKILGNVRFISELFKIKVIPLKLISQCLNQLLDHRCSKDSETGLWHIDEDAIEGALTLLQECGPELLAKN